MRTNINIYNMMASCTFYNIHIVRARVNFSTVPSQLSSTTINLPRDMQVSKSSRCIPGETCRKEDIHARLGC